MLRRFKKDGPGSVNTVEGINCLGAGLRSDRSDCVEEKRERESILDFDTESGGGGASLGLNWYRLPYSEVEVFFLDLRFPDIHSAKTWR